MRGLCLLSAAVVLTVLFAASSSAQDVGPDWVKVTADAGWRARDSSGELVYKDKLWLFGGWFDSFQAPPRDVWSSADGQAWTLVEKEAPWKHSDLPLTLTFGDKQRLKNDVWSAAEAGSHSESRLL